MTARQLLRSARAYARFRRALRAKRSCCNGMCTTSREALASQPLCHCGCGMPAGQHVEMRSAA